MRLHSTCNSLLKLLLLPAIQQVPLPDAACHVWITRLQAQARWSTFQLEKFCQVRAVNGFVAEDAVDGKVFGWPEALLSQAVQHAGRHSRRMSAQQIFLRLTLTPAAAIPACTCYDQDQLLSKIRFAEFWNGDSLRSVCAPSMVRQNADSRCKTHY